jgi:hypothetical protein
MLKSKSKSSKKRLKDTPQQQHARFVEAANKAEADESPDAMDKAFLRLDVTKLTSKTRHKIKPIS